MARNKYGGVCYYCHTYCARGDGHYERYAGRYRLIHAECVTKQRKEKAEAKQGG